MRAAAGTRHSNSWVPLAVLAVVILLLYLLWHVVLLFILAALFAFLIYPLVQLFDRRLPHLASIIAVYLLITIALTLVTGLLAPLLTQQFREFVDNIPAYIEEARGFVNRIQESYGTIPARWRGFADMALGEAQQAAVRLTQRTIPAAITFFSGLFTLIVFVPLLAFFMLLDYSGYRRMIYAIVPPNHRRTVDDLSGCMTQVLRNYFKGQLTLMTVVGMADGLGLYLVGMPYAAVLGVLGGLLEIVPNFGPLFTTIIVILVGLLIDPVMALQAGAVTIVVQLLENTFLAPMVMSKAVGLDPVTVVFAIFLGGSIAGIAGAIISIPLAMMIKIVILYFYVDGHNLPKSDMGICPAFTERRKPLRRFRRRRDSDA